MPELRAAAQQIPPPLHDFCAEYIEQIFPVQANQSSIAREAGLDLTACFDLIGIAGGQWSVQWKAGELVGVRRGLDPSAVVTYHTDPTTFEAVVTGRETPQQAFFAQRLEITGDLETALKLAMLFLQFIADNPVVPPHRPEEACKDDRA
jgi:predicted lipid carrier protein YhbT